VLKQIVKKYTPHLENMPLPDNAIRGTAVIVVRIDSMTGKYYD
jgi:hypothetical protein